MTSHEDRMLADFGVVPFASPDRPPKRGRSHKSSGKRPRVNIPERPNSPKRLCRTLEAVSEPYAQRDPAKACMSGLFKNAQLKVSALLISSDFSTESTAPDPKPDCVQAQVSECATEAHTNAGDLATDVSGDLSDMRSGFTSSSPAGSTECFQDPLAPGTVLRIISTTTHAYYAAKAEMQRNTGETYQGPPPGNNIKRERFENEYLTDHDQDIPETTASTYADDHTCSSCGHISPIGDMSKHRRAHDALMVLHEIREEDIAQLQRQAEKSELKTQSLTDRVTVLATMVNDLMGRMDRAGQALIGNRPVPS